MELVVFQTNLGNHNLELLTLRRNLHKTFVNVLDLFTNTFIFRMGQITIELYWDHAPETCRNFAELCRRGYYNNTKFHRIIRNFMIQGKDF